jgi:hypothetical protein
MTTPTMTSGSAPVPALDVSTAVTTTADSGRRRIATIAAPIPTATAAVIGNPGRCEHMMPPAGSARAPSA